MEGIVRTSNHKWHIELALLAPAGVLSVLLALLMGCGSSQATVQPTPGVVSEFPNIRGAHVTALAVDPLITTTVYVGTDGGGLWRYEQQGDVLSPVLDLSGLNILSLAVTTSDDEVLLYAGTWAQGLYRLTRSAGDTLEDWESTLLLPGRIIGALVASGDTVIVGTRDKFVQRSEDRGGNWSELSFGLPPAYINSIISTTHDLFLSMAELGVYRYRSEDRSARWEAVNTGLDYWNVAALAADNTGAAPVIYAATDQGVYSTQNLGESWQGVNTGLQGNALQLKSLFVADVIGQPTLYAGTYAGLYTRGADGQWRALPKSLVFPESSPMVATAWSQSGALLYMGTSGGAGFYIHDPTCINQENTECSPWLKSPVLEDLALVSVQALVASPDGSIFAGTWGDGVLRRQVQEDGSSQWRHASSGLPDPYVRTLLWQDDTLYAGTWGHGVFATTNGGVEWQDYNDEGLSSYRLISALAFTSEPTPTLYAALWGAGLYKRELLAETTHEQMSQENTWQQVRLVGVPSPWLINDLLIVPGGGTLYLATENQGIYRSTDGGSTWNSFNEGLGKNIQALSLRLASDRTLYATIGKKIYRHDLESASWQSLRSEERFHIVAPDPVEPDVLYAVGDTFDLSGDKGETWRQEADLDAPALTMLISDEGEVSIRRVILGTSGRGVTQLMVPLPNPGDKTWLLWPFYVAAGLVVLVGALGLMWMARTSGLPVVVLARQGRSVLAISLRYPDYRARWQDGTSLERLVLLLSPPGTLFSVTELADSLQQASAPPTRPEIKSALKRLTQKRLLVRVEDMYQVADLALHRVLWRQEGDKGISRLVAQVCSEHPLVLAATHFFPAAGFELVPVLDDPLSFTCRPQLERWQSRFSTPVYTRLIPDQPLDKEAVDETVKAAGPAAKFVFVVINQAPQDDGWLEIGTFRYKEIQVIPVTDTLLREAGEEQERLERYLKRFVGLGLDLYNVRHPVSDRLSFFGREALASELLERLAAGEDLAVLGLRKIGKSSLLQYMRNQAHFPIALIDLQAGTDLPGVYRRALHSWHETSKKRMPNLKWEPPSLYDEPRRGFVDAVQRLLDELGQEMDDPRLGLFVDEIDVIVPRPGNEVDDYLTFMRTLRGLAQELNQLSLLGAGVDTAFNRLAWIEGEQNPAFQFFGEVFVPPLDPTDCAQMVRNIGRQMELSYSAEAVELAVQQSGSHPFLARQLCSLAYRAQGRKPGEVPLDALQEAAGRFVREPATAAHLGESGMWGEVTNPRLWTPPITVATEKMLLALAEQQPQSSTELGSIVGEPTVYDAALAELRQRSVLEQVGTGLRITFDIFRRWIRLHKLGVE